MTPIEMALAVAAGIILAVVGIPVLIILAPFVLVAFGLVLAAPIIALSHLWRALTGK